MACDRPAELDLLESEWDALTPLQQVHRLALIQCTTSEEWLVLGDIFRRRGLVLDWREAA